MYRRRRRRLECENVSGGSEHSVGVSGSCALCGTSSPETTSITIVAVDLDLERRLEEEDDEATGPRRNTDLCGGRSFAPRAIAGENKCALQSMTLKRVAATDKHTNDICGCEMYGL